MKKVFLLIIYVLSLSFTCKAEKGGEQGYLAITYEVVYASCRDHNDPFCYYWIIPIINHNDYNAFPILISADDFYSMFAGKYSYRDTVNLRGNISDFNGSSMSGYGDLDYYPVNIRTFLEVVRKHRVLVQKQTVKRAVKRHMERDYTVKVYITPIQGDMGYITKCDPDQYCSTIIYPTSTVCYDTEFWSVEWHQCWLNVDYLRIPYKSLVESIDTQECPRIYFGPSKPRYWIFDK